MPFGMCRRQNSNVLPKTATLSPRRMRWAAVESPYGPAPTTTASYGAAGTDCRGIFVTFTKLTRLLPERGRLSPPHLAQRGTREIGGGARGGGDGPATAGGGGPPGGGRGGGGAGRPRGGRGGRAPA